LQCEGDRACPFPVDTGEVVCRQHRLVLSDAALFQRAGNTAQFPDRSGLALIHHLRDRERELKQHKENEAIRQSA
jgi:hypothetical protein